MNWIVVKTKPNRERWAQSNIEAHGCATYCPRYKNEQSKSIRSVFPSYVFVSLISNNWWFLRATFGVLYPVMMGDEPSKVPQRIINQLKDRERFGLVQLDQSPFKVNQKIKVSSGLFAGSSGLFQESSNGRIRVLLDCLGQFVPTTLNAGMVEGA